MNQWPIKARIPGAHCAMLAEQEAQESRGRSSFAPGWSAITCCSTPAAFPPTA